MGLVCLSSQIEKNIVESNEKREEKPVPHQRDWNIILENILQDFLKILKIKSMKWTKYSVQDGQE